jgi:hypothetical protein
MVITADSSADEAQGGRFSIAPISVIYALTILVVGVGNSTFSFGSQYLAMTRDALIWSSESPLPPHDDFTLSSMEDVTFFASAVLEQMHDCNSVTPPSQVLYWVCSATMEEMASAAHGA